jgi:hypothetical protein
MRWKAYGGATLWTVVVALLLLAASASALELVQPAGSPYPTTNPAFSPNGDAYVGGEAVGDFNGDGISDVAVVDATGAPVPSAGESVSILLGNPNGTLSNAPGSPVALFSGGEYLSRGPIVAGDFTGNGKLDLAVVDEIYDRVWILLGKGNGEFSVAGQPIPYASNGLEASIAMGDFTGNGIEDLAVVSGSDLNILAGNGSGGFSTVTGSPITLSGYPTSIVAGDFTGDGRDDLAIPMNDAVTVYLSTGKGQFQPAPESPIQIGAGAAGIATGDLTGNGKLDLVTTDQSDDTVTVLLGDGDGDFAPASGSPFPVPVGPAPEGYLGLPDAVAIGNFECNGAPDLAVANFNGPSSDVAVLLGDGHGGFTDALGSPFPAGGNPGPIEVGNFSGKGGPDLAVVNPFQGTVTLLDNATCDGTGVARRNEGSEDKEGSGGSRSSEGEEGSEDKEGSGRNGSSESKQGSEGAQAQHNGVVSNQQVLSSGPVSVTAGSDTADTPKLGQAPTIESLALFAPIIRGTQGPTLEIRLASAGDVIVEFERAVRTRVHGRLIELPRKVGSVELGAHAGMNRIEIRRVDGRPLTVGSYTLLVYSQDATARSSARQLRLTVRRQTTAMR